MNQSVEADEAATPSRWRTALREHPRLRRELWLLTSGILIGLILMPMLVYLVGVTTLGPYTAGGLGSFLADLYRGLFHGWLPGWGIVLGPYLLVMLLRACLGIRRWWGRRLEAS